MQRQWWVVRRRQQRTSRAVEPHRFTTAAANAPLCARSEATATATVCDEISSKEVEIVRSQLSGLDLVRRYLVRGACALLRPPAHVHHVQSVSQSVSHHVVAPTCGVGVGSLYRCSTPRPISGITVGRCLSALGTGVSTEIRCFFVGLKQSVDPKVKGLMQRSRTENVLSSALSAPTSGHPQQGRFETGSLLVISVEWAARSLLTLTFSWHCSPF